MIGVGVEMRRLRDCTSLTTTVSAVKKENMEREWEFDRYRNGTLMAEGAKVHAKTEEEALKKAKALFADERDSSTFRLSKKGEGWT